MTFMQMMKTVNLKLYVHIAIIQFVTDIDSEINEEVECPECHNVIELDWNEGECSHECSDCKK